MALEDIFSNGGLINCGAPRSLFFLIYILDLPQALNKAGSYLNTGDMCIFYQDQNVGKT